MCPSGRQTSTRAGLVAAGLIIMDGQKMYGTIILDQMDADNIHHTSKDIYCNHQTKKA